MDTIEALARIVGEEAIRRDPEELKVFQSDESFVTGELPECIVQARTAEEVRKIVCTANENGFALVPCSSLGRHGRGDTVPQVAGAVIVDMSGMRSIIRIDRRNKVAMIEPGVTFAELHAEVEKAGMRLEMPLLPRGSKSVVSSLLDREPTTGPKYNWDAIDPLCCLEMVLGTGDLFRTGNAAGPGTLEEQWAAGQAQKVSMGPAQTDIGRLIQGAQGSLGIATWATLKLELLPSLRKGFLVPGQDLEALIDFTYRILWRKLPDTCFILNRVNFAAVSGTDSKGLPPWVLVYSLSGLDHFPEERLDYMEKDIHEIAGEFRVKPVRKIDGVSADRLLETLGRPCAEPHWKLRGKGGCQDLFFLTTLDRSPEFVRAVEPEVEAQGMSSEEVGVYIQPIRHGTGCHLEFNWRYDPNSPEGTQRIRALMEGAGGACMNLGGFFSRPYSPLTKSIYEKCPDTVSALRKVKGIFDPRDVMNPGRLCFGKEG